MQSACLRRWTRHPYLSLIVAAVIPTLALAQMAEPADPPAIEPLTPTLGPEQIRTGMQGYGLTVFQGTKVEPFPIEVVSVMLDFGPDRAVIWIRCPGERMQLSGPVQGMSGSPIYVWDDGEPHELGQGGKLIGAFAYGFGASKDCYVGVQPIGLMRETAGRVSDPEAAAAIGPRGASPGQTAAVLKQLITQADRLGVAPDRRWRAEAILTLIDPLGTSAAVTADPIDAVGRAPSVALSLAIPSQPTADLFAPMLRPMGVLPIAVPSRGRSMSGHLGAVAGNPPPGIDAEAIRFEPGSVLSIPLAHGPLDMSAIGTVTEVLPDGRVTAFGHAMFGEGDAAVPMATGFVHMVMPSLFGSFKLGGSGAIRGTIVRDENSAVVGVPGESFSLAPVDVTIDMPGQETINYHYEVVRHRRLTPFIAAIVVLQSLTAVTDLPTQNTTRLTGEIRFSGGHTLAIDSAFADAASVEVLTELFPVLHAMITNPHEPLQLESMAVHATVDPISRAGSLLNARLNRARYAPGDTLGISLQTQSYSEAPAERLIELEIPAGLAEGEYDLIVCDAPTYMQTLFETHPHLLEAANTADLKAAVQRVLSVANDSMYVVLQLPETGIAVGRQEMPRLPSSYRALVETATSTATTPYYEWVEKTIPMGGVIRGAVHFTINVRDEI